MRRPRSHIRRALLPLAAALAVLLLAGCGPTVEVVVAVPPSPSANQMVVGVTHNEFTIGKITASTPRSTELAILSQIPVQNTFLMGWGVGNPEPSPGVYDWTYLDQRIALIQSTGAEPVLTLCCAPDWMKGGAAGTTDWTQLTVAPQAAHFQDFADLAAAAARRYPQVKKFQVWNEMKGFYDPVTNNWDSVTFTNFYNIVYTAVKAARPDAQVGGPYAPLDLWSSAQTMSHPSNVSGPWGVVDKRPLDLLEYWLAHKVGADFVTLDGWTKTRDQQFITDPYTSTDVYLVMTQWLRQRTNLPIWWSEFHAADPSWSQAKQDAVTTLALSKMAQGGASMALLWSPQSDGTSCTSCLWTDPALGAATMTPFAQSVAMWRRCLPVGAAWRATQSADPNQVAAFGTDRGTVVINRSTGVLNAKVGEQTVPLGVDGVGVAATDPGCSR